MARELYSKEKKKKKWRPERNSAGHMSEKVSNCPGFSLWGSGEGVCLFWSLKTIVGQFSVLTGRLGDVFTFYCACPFPDVSDFNDKQSSYA